MNLQMQVRRMHTYIHVYIYVYVYICACVRVCLCADMCRKKIDRTRNCKGYCAEMCGVGP